MHDNIFQHCTDSIFQTKLQYQIPEMFLKTILVIIEASTVHFRKGFVASVRCYSGLQDSVDVALWTAWYCRDADLIPPALHASQENGPGRKGSMGHIVRTRFLALMTEFPRPKPETLESSGPSTLDCRCCLPMRLQITRDGPELRAICLQEEKVEARTIADEASGAFNTVACF